MKAKPRYWTPEQHRRYLETLGTYLPAIISSTAKPIGAIALMVALLSGKIEVLWHLLSRW